MAVRSKFVSGVDASPGKVPTADNSSVGADLIAWRELQVRLRKSVDGGVAFDNQTTEDRKNILSFLKNISQIIWRSERFTYVLG